MTDTLYSPGAIGRRFGLILPMFSWAEFRISRCLFSQEEYIKDEMKNLKRELIRAKEEIKRIQSVPLVIGQFNEIIDANYGIVGEIECTAWLTSLPLCGHGSISHAMWANTVLLSSGQDIQIFSTFKLHVVCGSRDRTHVSSKPA